VVLLLADIARVPAQSRNPLFRDCVRGCVMTVWDRDMRAVSLKPSRALVQAATAARNLHEATSRMNKTELDWLKRLSEQERSFIVEWCRDLPSAARAFSYLFSVAIGRPTGSVPSTQKRGRREGTVSDKTFQDFVWDLLLAASVAGGDFTLDKNFKKGSLIDALDILRPYLPKGVMPNVLPLGTIQRIKTKFSQLYPQGAAA
jgi:hypothetical protein